MDINPVAFKEITNRETLMLDLGLNDADTGEPIDLTDLTFECEIRRQRGVPFYDGYSPNYNGVGSDSPAPIITLTLDNGGLIVLTTGVLRMYATTAQMRSLCPDTYSIALTVSDGVDTRQIFLGTLPVLYGGVA